MPKVHADINSAGDTYIQVTLSGGEHVHELTEPRLEAILSTDAELVATVAEMRVGGMRVLMPHPPGSTQHLPIGTKLYAAPTAPSVAVKALEWDALTLNYSCATSAVGTFHEVKLIIDGYGAGKWVRSGGDLGVHFDCAQDAMRAEQYDYENRIRSALSAQFLDVAGWQSMDSAPKDGSEFVAGRRYPSSNEFTVHTYKWDANRNYWGCKRHGICIRQEYQKDFVWFGLPAARADNPKDKP